MRKIKKLLWMIFILWIVFFIICDEKWIKIEFQDWKIIFTEIQKSELNNQENLNNEGVIQKKIVYKNSDIIHLYAWFKKPNILRNSAWLDPDFFKEPIVYKNSNRIKIYSWFEHPLNIRNSAWLDPEFLAKLEQEKFELENQRKNQKYTWPNIISLDNDSTISNIFQPDDDSQNSENLVEPYTLSKHEVNLNKAQTKEQESSTGDLTWENKNNNISELWMATWYRNVSIDIDGNIIEQTPTKKNNTVKVEKYEPNTHSFGWLKGEEKEIEDSNLVEVEETNASTIKVERYGVHTHIFSWLEGIKKEIKEKDNNQNIEINDMEENNLWEKENDVDLNVVNYENNVWWEKFNNDKKWVEINKTKLRIKKYQLKRHDTTLRKWIAIVNEFVIDNVNNWGWNSDWFNEEIYENLITDEEIDINTLESENDEFLKKVFEKTKDVNVMNLIVETYLNEYQFIKAKKFIESLPQADVDQIDPILNLRVAFNSFALTSNTTESTLTFLVEKYQSNNKISEEDVRRYLCIIALMSRNYDRFFEIAWNFTLDKHQAFASKVQWYKDQISKQMWMPEYYFDTLMSLELFNHWFFQPAKVLALYSLQQNPNYILPHQVLAYANFLTNSRDTSIEYLKKLVDLDPNNAEKYRFLMWVAFYRDEKYEQSVVMLSMIKDENLRLDTNRYLINDYIKLNQKNKLISTWNKILWSENLVASDFYTYFYETFFRPYSQWDEFELYAYDTELANKMLRVCSTTLQNEEKAVCTYWTIGRNIALWQFDGLEKYLQNLVSEYPQWYLYQALWDYYIQQWDLDKAKVYLLKAISLTQEKSERSQIKKLLQDTM